MASIRRVTAVVLVLGCLLLQSSRASAGPIWDWFCGPCPPADYSPAYYWAPNLARAYNCVLGPHIPVVPPDRHPEVPPTMAILKFRCPPVVPEATTYSVPRAPTSSGFQYLEFSGAGGAATTKGKE